MDSDGVLMGRLEVVNTGRRRRWSDAEKVRIVEESLSGRRLASATARRHGISRTLLFRWRKAYREGRLDGVAGSDRGGQRAAVMYTLIVTAKMNDVDPQAWLADVLARIAEMPQARLHELLPWNWKAARESVQAA